MKEYRKNLDFILNFFNIIQVLYENKKGASVKIIMFTITLLVHASKIWAGYSPTPSISQPVYYDPTSEIPNNQKLLQRTIRCLKNTSMRYDLEPLNMVLMQQTFDQSVVMNKEL